MFRWLRERRQRREREARERREQLRRKAQEGGITRALQQMNHYSAAAPAPAQPPAHQPSVAEAFAAQLVINQLAQDATVNGADCRSHVTQAHHGSHSSHSSHDYSAPSHSSHDSGGSYDSGSSSSGSDSSW